MIIENPTKVDLLLAQHGWVLFEEIAAQTPNVLPNAKQYIYRSHQMDLIKIEDNKIIVTFYDSPAEMAVVIDTQQGYIQYKESILISFKEMEIFAAKVKELIAIEKL